MSDWKPEDFAVPEDPEKDRFHDYALPVPLLHAIADLEFAYCTPIQSAVLPFSLSDYDVTGQAQTGTGKTAAFLITILARLWENPLEEAPEHGTPRSLVLAPTRELALQIESDAQDLCKYLGASAQCVVGGIDFQKQLDRIKQRPVDILVATPGRLLDFINRRYINLKQVEVLVIDEADRMLDMGFIPDVRRIVYQTPHKRNRQTLFFSATFNDDVMRLANSWTMDPEHVAIAPETVATDT
ncbi:MAG: DEAD/DEAH box helicase, partial [Gammaproteobacteria bacterium]|nr:DEAD/DEAH box helicase [Gammaproteobacteria bacterium]